MIGSPEEKESNHQLNNNIMNSNYYIHEKVGEKSPFRFLAWKVSA